METGKGSALGEIEEIVNRKGYKLDASIGEDGAVTADVFPGDTTVEGVSLRFASLAEAADLAAWREAMDDAVRARRSEILDAWFPDGVFIDNGSWAMLGCERDLEALESIAKVCDR